MSEEKGRSWLITKNNPGATVFPGEWPHIRYAVWQLEMGESGTAHYQMYLNFKEPVRMAFIRKLEGIEKCHCEVVHNKPKAVAYCCKPNTDFPDDTSLTLEGPFWFPSEAVVRKHGKTGKGARTDLDQLVELINDDAADDVLWDDVPKMVIKYPKGIQAARLAKGGRARQGAIDAVVYWGPSGTGKSHRLLQECPPGPLWFWADSGKWFDGYQGQPGIVFDEFHGGWMPYRTALRLFSGFPMRGETKGGHVEIRALRFRFSTNIHPKDWWSGRVGAPPWREDPLRRRLGQVRKMTVVYEGLDEVYDSAEEVWDAMPQPARDPAVRAAYGQRQIE